MEDRDKTKEQLINELVELRQRITEMETSEARRRPAEKALRRSEKELTAIFDGARDGIVVLDKTRKVMRINEYILQVGGYAEEELVGKRFNVLKMFPPQSMAKMLSTFDKLEEGQDVPPYEIEVYVKKGEKRIVEVRNSLLRKRGSFVGTIAIMRDITERKEMQERLARSEKLAILGQLAGGVSHELRNPLGTISNCAYLLKTTLPDADKTTKECLDMIASEVRNATKIIHDLLDFSRTRLPDREEAAVSELVAEVLEKQPPPEGVQVTTEIAPDLPPVYVDPRQMGQVLVNLVTNAYQAMREGGKLTISARVEEGQVAISVTDTGYGISQQHKAKLFEPLFTTKARGIGLGLAVSRILVEANGGSIEVESEEGEGSTFTVRLPTKEVLA